MDYKTKYLKYRTKYLNLKKMQIGGVRFISIENNGSGNEPGLISQCIWISIRDYLNYHRGIIRTVVDLKRSVGLGPETDHTEYDNDNQLLRNALLRLSRQLNITLHFFYTSHEGFIHPNSVRDNNMRPFHIVNNGTGNNVYIASFGGHFELIIQGPNYNLPRHQNATIHGAVYQPKVQLHNVFINPSQVTSPDDQQIVQASINLVEVTQNIDYFKEELKRLQIIINQNEEGIDNIMNLDLDPQEKEALISGYLAVIDFNKSIIDKLKSKIENLNQEKQSLELIIN